MSVARYRVGREIVPHFSGNQRIDSLLRSIGPHEAPPGSELWITDISWTDKETDRHLCALAASGVRVYWFDHHRTALRRHASGEIAVPFEDFVISEEVSAARLVYEYLDRQPGSGARNEKFESFAPVVAMADDTDRWIHAISGSRELALTIRTMGADQHSLSGYEALLSIDEAVTYTPAMREAHDRARRDIASSFQVAEQSRISQPVPGTPYTLVVALCEGHPSEIGDSWGKSTEQTIFVFFDLKGEGISLRRSPDCAFDLSSLAQFFGGGGHPAAAGCRPPDLPRRLAQRIADLFTPALADLA